MDKPFGEIYEYIYEDAVDIPSVKPFPQFSLLPPELRIMIWEKAVPRRAISLMLDDDEEITPLPPPAIAHVCRESRGVYLNHYTKDPFVALGWFNHATDIFIWKPIPDLLFKIHWLFRDDNFFHNLTSLTLHDACSSSWVEDLHDAAEWDPMRAYASWRLPEDQDPTGLRFIFRFVQEERCALRTLNIFNHTARSRDTFTLRSSLLSIPIAAMFGVDSVVTVDMTDTQEVARVADVLRTDEWDNTRACVNGLTRIERELDAEQRRAHWNGLWFDYKLAWLSEIYQRDNVRGLPDDPPDVDGWDHESLMFRLNWDESDPVVKKCLRKMPEIKFVYVILTQN
ncbi:uncharacterized protein GGS22DRAFT_198753 [Annulohypoxylon maeteangense]|uniref:uncharacterized protein n=1 Tax=Annulohypoxylon maeteangense TaxID=1927788 RepID=UPI0020077C9A|nr:uncharacterized protein GGS22DRAFT_198753 [Annulohypoxylon maeteangense]KAI0887508.1 hypothetical protein GGS22DRAFT_198753 [Annulohypoxylon maeteangense]